MATVSFCKESAREAIIALKKGNTKLVREFLEAVELVLPSRESYKNRGVEETSKQKNRKEKLKKGKR